jgi:undecaprenyl-diphosphatase
VSFVQALILGAVQGATEFLPVSSSGHLVLVPWLLGWPAPDLAFGAVAHWGTAAAVVVYFWDEVWGIARALALWLVRVVRSRGAQLALIAPQARLGLLVALGSVPAAVLGYLFEGFFEEMFSQPVPAAAFLLLTALLLGLAESIGKRQRVLADLKWPDAVLVGLAQAAAILPGVSRSGATIAAGLGTGLQRDAAATFSFLLSVPIVLGAGLFEVLALLPAASTHTAASLAAGFVASLVVGYGAIRLLMLQVQRGRLYPYAAYCAMAGIGSLIVAATRGS